MSEKHVTEIIKQKENYRFYNENLFNLTLILQRKMKQNEDKKTVQFKVHSPKNLEKIPENSDSDVSSSHKDNDNDSSFSSTSSCLG